MKTAKNVRRALCTALAAALLLPALPARAAREEEISANISDYTGAGTLIAVIEAGFDVTHAAFSVAPASPTVDKRTLITKLGMSYADAYVSEKIPLALDYTADGFDTAVYNVTDAGTALASVAAGHYKGAGDRLTEDGKVIHESDYLGAAPDAQILFMKAAADTEATLKADAVSAAVYDAVRLGADVILTNFSRIEAGENVKEAFAAAQRANVPVYGGAGEISSAVRALLAGAPAAFSDRGTLPVVSSYPAAVTVGAVRDPYAQILSFTAGDYPVFYADSSLTYLGKSFAEYFAGREIGITAVPGYGTAQDFEAIDVRGKIAVVLRGELSFSDKAKNAAAAGAIGMIVADNGGGISQMALTDSPIPAVMITEADGAYLLGADAPDTIRFESAQEGMASFSAVGATEDFKATVSFCCIGQNVLTAGAEGYAYRSGTQYAAAKAAGYCARAAQYLRANGKSADHASALLASSARPLVTEDGTLPFRTAGAGVLDETCVFPKALVTSSYAQAVPLHILPESGSARITVTVTNLTEEAKRYTLHADFAADEVDADGFLTGVTVPVTGVRCTTGLLSQDITENETTVLVGARRSVSLTLSVSLRPGLKTKLSALMPNGFFLDGTISFTSDAESVSHPLSVFRGDPDDLPLADASVFDGGAMLVPASLSVRMPDAGGVYTIGTVDRTAAIRTYDEAYSILHPLTLRGGALIFNLTPLRNIESVTARFTDADGHLIREVEAGSAARYLTAGKQTSLPLWDFSAADNAEYVFPDGTYTCEIILQAGETKQSMTFTLHADSEKPVIDEISLETAQDGTRTLTAAASDNTALSSLSVYDGDNTYALSFVSGKEASLTAEIPAHLGAPLYIEATDYAGGYTVIRLTQKDLAKMTEDTP